MEVYHHIHEFYSFFVQIGEWHIGQQDMMAISLGIALCLQVEQVKE